MAVSAAAPAVREWAPDGPHGVVGLAHLCTLLGAIDSHLGGLRHTRPWLVAEREAFLESMASAWMAEGGPNWLPAVRRDWIALHLRTIPIGDRRRAVEAVADLLHWAAAEIHGPRRTA